MAKKTTKKVINDTKAAGKIDTIVSSIKKKESLIGLVTVVVLVSAVLGLVNKSSFKGNQNSVSDNVVEKVDDVLTPSVTATNETEKVAVAQPTPTVYKIAEIKMLADTSVAYEQIIVKNGDSFSRISKRVCGTEEFSLFIKKFNGYTTRQSLQPGDVLKVTCSQ